MNFMKKLLAFSLAFILISMSVPKIGLIGSTVQAEELPGSINAYEKFYPISNDGFGGNAKLVINEEGILRGTEPGAWIKFADVDFGNIKPTRIEFEVALNSSNKLMEIRLDSPTGTLIGSGIIALTGDWVNFSIRDLPLDYSEPLGIHDIYFLFSLDGHESGNGNFKSFRFYGDGPITGLYVTAERTVMSVIGQKTELEVTGQTSTGEYKALPVGTEFTYASSDTEVVTVDEAGVVTAVDYGTAVITVSTIDESLTGTIEIRVTERNDIFYYVSPDGSDEDNSGSKEEPFKTITKAQAVVRDIIASGMAGNVTVYLREGVYYIAEKIMFDALDSGRDGYTVQYSAYPEEEPIIDSSIILTDWEDAGGGVYKSTTSGSMSFGALYEDNVRSFTARHPSKGKMREDYLYVAAMNSANKRLSFHFNEGDIPPGLVPAAGLEVEIWNGGANGEINWNTTIREIESIDYIQRLITLKGSNLAYDLGPGTRYYIRGSKLLLDAPGEFYVDKVEGAVYYYPRNSSINEAIIAAPRLVQMIQFNGTVDAPVKNMTLEGLTIRNSNYTPTGISNNYSMINVENADSITIKDNHLYNAGRLGISFRPGTTNSTISGNYMHDIGSYAIQVEHSHYNIVTNNYIHDVGTMFGHGHGIRITDASHNEVTHNRIHDSTRYAISIKALGSTHNLIQYNEAFNCNTDSQDTGVIEMGVPGRDNVIDQNRVYNSDIHMSYGFGIYLDDKSSGTTVSNNLVHGLQQSGEGLLRNVIFAKGIENNIINNYFVNNNASVGPFRSGGENIDLNVERNIFYNSGDTVFLFADWTLNRFAKSEYQLLYNDNGTYGISNAPGAVNFEQWRMFNNFKYDQLSKIAPPKFMDEEKNDYRLRYDSPARELGIQELDVANMGLLDSFKFGDKTDPLEYIYPISSNGKTLSYVSLASDETWQLDIMGRTETGYIADLSSAEITYTSSDSGIATVDSESGIITGVSSGVAEIKATVSRGSDLYETFIHVLVDDSMESLNVNVARSQLKAGENTPLHITAESKLGAFKMFSTQDVGVVVTNNSPELVSIDEKGIITALANGNATIEASVTVGGITKTEQITINVYGAISAYVPIYPISSSEHNGLDIADGLMSNTLPGSWVLFKNVDFENIISNRIKMEVAVPASHAGGIFEIHVDSPTGPLLGSVTINATEGWDDFQEQITAFDGRVTGVKDVYLVFSENNTSMAGNIKWFSFYREPVPPTDPWKVVNYGKNTNGDNTTGYVDTLDGKYIVKSDGANIWNAADDFTFMYQDIEAAKANNFTIIAKIDSVFQAHTESSSGVMIRDNNTADSFNVIARVRPDGGLRFTYRNTEKPGTWYQSKGNIPFPVTLKLTRQGDLFTGYYFQPNDYDGEWIQFGQISTVMSGDVMAGIGTFSQGTVATEAKVYDISIIEEAVKYSLIKEATTNGTITVNPAKDFYTAGEEVTITATPSTGYKFVGFTGSITSASSPVTVTMDSNKTIGATFEPMVTNMTTALDLSKTVTLYQENDPDGQMIVSGINTEGRKSIEASELEYTSSDTAVVTVDANGVIDVHSAGISIITSTYTNEIGTEIEGKILITVYRDLMKKQDFESYTAKTGETIITDNPRTGLNALGATSATGYYGYDLFGPGATHEKLPMMVGEIWFYDNGATVNSTATVSFGANAVHKPSADAPQVAFPQTLAMKFGILTNTSVYYGFVNDPVARKDVGPGAVDLTGTDLAGTGYTGNATKENIWFNGQNGYPTVPRTEGWHQVVCVVNGGNSWDNVGTANGTTTYYLDGVKVFEENYVPLNIYKIRGQKSLPDPFNSIYDDISIVKYYLSEEEPVVEYTLTKEATANGTITIDPVKETYAEGETVTVTATADAGYRFVGFTGASTATSSSVTITMDADKTIGAIFELVTNFVELDGIASIQEGQIFDVEVSLKSVVDSVYAEDIIISYDSALFEYVAVQTSNDQSVIASVYNEVPGAIRVLTINDEVVSGDLDLLTITFKAKQVGTTSSGNISIVSAELGTAPVGGVISAGTDSITIEVVNVDKSMLMSTIANAATVHSNAVEGSAVGNYPAGTKAVLQAAIDQAQAVADNQSATQSQVDTAVSTLVTAIASFEEGEIQPPVGDLNGDGAVNVGDLAIVAYHYQKDSSSADWETAKIADMNGDNKVDIMDLVAVVNEILGK